VLRGSHHFLDNRLTVVRSEPYAPASVRPKGILGTHFGRWQRRNSDHCETEMISSIEKFQSLLRESNPRPSGCNGKLQALSLCLNNQALRHEDKWGSASRVPRLLELGTN
jgi:hypothetical protein